MEIKSFYMEISEKNLVNNINYLKEKYKKSVLPVIKANAYGHGIELIAKALYKNGYKEFSVARLNEALKILKNEELKKCKVLVFETIDESSFSYIKDYDSIIVTANSFRELKNLVNNGISSKQIQLKIDFGFGRNGIELLDILKLKSYIVDKNLEFNGIYSHLYATDFNEGKELIDKFNEVVFFLGKEKFQMIHIQNSVGILFYGAQDFMTHMRSGIFIYGLQEEGFFHEGLKQVFQLKGKVAGIRDIKDSKYLAYTSKDNLSSEDYKNIVKIKIGYGDGFLKCNENSMCIINKKPYKILSVTMDNTFIAGDNSICEGDEVILYPNVNLIRNNTGMHICEILPLINERIERVLK
ncbi:alanine racemase [Cetobacterium somerae]|uniref:alanine racemase n=1 Tax=Cetobacterium sp. NK01 TaxID=2993530 RepID=UPI002116BA34|nr:alanine racemase [Cetobacterium sp. NK01]MCQ8213433.1 alanine racemase [Cetobacterium sp. NK01]